MAQFTSSQLVQVKDGLLVTKAKTLDSVPPEGSETWSKFPEK